MSTKDTSFASTQFEPWRALVIYALLILAITAVVARLFTLQVLEKDSWLAQAEENRTREIISPTSRGIIYDRNGTILASNVAAYNIVITPAYLPNDQADIQRVYRELSAQTGIPTGFPLTDASIEAAKLVSPCIPGPGIAQMVYLQNTNAPYKSVKIQCNVSEKMALTVRQKAMNWPGVSVEIEPIRNYPTGSLTADVIGFLGPIPASLQTFYEDLNFVSGRDKVGYAGVESYFDEILLGRNGRRVVEVDVAGQELRNLQPPADPVPGENLVLTIDTRLQKAAEAALIGEVNYWNGYFGKVRISSAVTAAINPKTGEILAMVSYPTYENNRMARVIPSYYYKQLEEDPRKPLLNHAVSDEYPPGSVFKLSTATGALNEGVVSLSQVIQAPGELKLTESFSPNDPGNERTFVDWNPAGFGTIDFLRCIAYSSNVCFYKLGGGYKDEIPEGLGILRLGEYARALSYGRQTGIELPGEASGLIPSPQWKRINRGENWSTGDTYIASVGQGYVLATPLQVLMSAATVANNGKQMQPTLVHAITDSDGKTLERWLNVFADGHYTISSTSDLTALSTRQISPFSPTMRWDVTVDPLIAGYTCENSYCTPTDTQKTVRPDVIQKIQEGMRLAVTDSRGTLQREIYQLLEVNLGIPFAGKTGTAEYCDNVAQAQNLCQFGAWPSHAWTVAFAPYNDPEIAVVAFAYNGGEGASVAGPIVRKVMAAYFELRAIDAQQNK
ncbi:MAG: penicillin-binding protein 2 [Anaerolineae bacterium CG_4_9_14_3_um_filter_57_17]|nr:penicillin-binding protein 2 [bacterium]NCT22072.1 penicillin-binding protein 2 [bacterium]OIO84896.1 MAG: penicillin-binding protein 2 [Anaerolineae bacterium CG2_30_57_67]PJB64815.1 MAG: penicillin-binding protein 2 [Anaerolineae bacterium CG_4_9_14_3_um_filter_57_17]